MKIIIPGCGLGRLTYEIAKLGFNVHGNDMSIYMMMTINYIFNNCKKSNEFLIQPYIHNHLDYIELEDRYRILSIPDECPCENNLFNTDRIKMEVGDFNYIFEDDNCN